jgi:glycosyltransferase involved in cell wall biosynthesis
LLAVGQPVYDLPSMLEALARCGEKKYSAILQMSFASRVRAMLQNVLGQATEMEVITEAVASEANADGAADFDEKVKEAQRRNWLVCWKNMTFKDLHGFPLWETQLHDVLQASFPELQSIFLHYCGSSIAGSESIGSATRVGLMEFLTIAKDTDLCTKEFKVDEVTRHFTSANAQTAIANSGSSDRNKLKPPKTPKVEAATSRKAQKAAAVDAQLNLFEFINLLVRVAFWRANPQWGSKYNKKDLTPVPESTQILLEECILPKAKRDTSGEFKKVLASDASTQAVLGEYREQLLRCFAVQSAAGRAMVLPKYVDFALAGRGRPVAAGDAAHDIVNVGTFAEKRKNQGALLPLAERHRIALVGAGPLLAEARRGVPARLRPRVQFLGRLPHPQVFEVLQQSRIMVHSSTMDGLPRATIEAMACGVPVVALRSTIDGGIPHGVAGLLVSEAALPHAAEMLLADDELRLRMGRNARRFVERHHGEDAIEAAAAEVIRILG